MKKLLFMSGMLALTACAPVPNDLMKPSANTLKIREAQSRHFEVNSDMQLLRASVSVLQDMGYTIKESSSECGVLTATKEANAVSPGQVAGAIAMAILCGTVTPIDLNQSITVTLVVLDKDACNKASARTTFQRVVTRSDRSEYAQTITDPLVYQEFYDKLDKALFLEVNQL